MTHIQIETGKDTIEMRPQLDESSRELIHGLGLTGISWIVDCDSGRGEGTVFGYQRVEDRLLSHDAKLIADAMGAAGVEVEIMEKPLPRATVPSARRRSFLSKLKVF